MGTPIGAYIRLGQVLDLPTNADDLARVLEEHSKFRTEINLQSGSIPLPLLREASMIQAREKIKNSLTPDKDLIQSIE
ncbi:MAG: hypothetical protein VYE50_04410, partial [Candidatus Thermoplasmatota archaeon]|nr:hypothetical protein [Candidatus Thermoplasmatota archaeon]